VDFVLGDHVAVEVKAKEHVGAQDLRSLAEEHPIQRCVCVSLERRRREVDGVTILPLRQFLDELWAGVFGV